MKSLAVVTVCIVAVIVAPWPDAVKFWCLLTILFASLPWLLEEAAVARAYFREARRVAAIRDAETVAILRRIGAEFRQEKADWDSLDMPGVIPFSTTPPSMRPRVLRSVPIQRDGGAR